MNRKVTWLLGVTILLGSLIAGNYYLGWKIPYLPTQSTLPSLYTEPYGTYKGYSLWVTVGAFTYYWARAISDPTVVSPHFDTLDEVKVWIDGNPAPTPPPPQIDTTMLMLIGLGICLVAGTYYVWKRH
jgi:hypothetical protein